MTCFAGIFVSGGKARNVTFEAESPEEAVQIAERWGVGVTGEARETAGVTIVAPEPESYDIETAGKILSPKNPLSRSTLIRMVAREELDRVPNTRRFLITRESIVRLCSRRSRN